METYIVGYFATSVLKTIHAYIDIKRHAKIITLGNHINMETKNINYEELENLNQKELNAIKREVIKTNSLLEIPSILMPDVAISDYFFVSYSHKDYKEVYCNIISLQENGVNIWYDRGIPAGTNWKEIANAYMYPFPCKAVIFYMSENSLISQAVINELEYAISINKPLILINLPFTNDYQYKGESVLNKTFSINDMADILFNNGLLDLKKKNIIEKMFNREIIYLPYEMHDSLKAEKIKTCLNLIPDYELDTYELQIEQYRSYDPIIQNVLRFNKLNNYSIASLHADKLHVDIDNIDVVEIGSCVFANAKMLEVASFKGAPFENIPTIINIGAFYGCDNLTSIENINIENIGAFAFGKCNKLTTVSSNGPKMSVGERAFYKCESLKHIKANLSYVGRRAFAGCTSLKGDLRISDRIDYAAFYGTSIESIYSYSGQILRSAFHDCKRLKKVILNDGSGDKNRTSPIIEKMAFSNCTSLKEVSFPWIKTIEEAAFEGCKSLKKITFPEPPKDYESKIGYNAFLDSGLEEITLCSNKIEINEYAFERCNNLKTINLLDKEFYFRQVYKMFNHCRNLKTINYVGKKWEFGYNGNIDQPIDNHSYIVDVVCSDGIIKAIWNEESYFDFDR